VIDYHPGKANFVAYALCQKSLFALRAMNAHMAMSDDSLIIAKVKEKLLFVQQIYDTQEVDNYLLAK